MTIKRHKISDHNTQTDEVIVRDMTDAELAQYELDAAQSQLQADELDAKVAAKISALAKLAALGLTEDEAKAIIA